MTSIVPHYHSRCYYTQDALKCSVSLSEEQLNTGRSGRRSDCLFWPIRNIRPIIRQISNQSNVMPQVPLSPFFPLLASPGIFPCCVSPNEVQIGTHYVDFSVVVRVMVVLCSHDSGSVLLCKDSTHEELLLSSLSTFRLSMSHSVPFFVCLFAF